MLASISLIATALGVLLAWASMKRPRQGVVLERLGGLLMMAGLSLLGFGLNQH